MAALRQPANSGLGVTVHAKRFVPMLPETYTLRLGTELAPEFAREWAWNAFVVERRRRLLRRGFESVVDVPDGVVGRASRSVSAKY